MRVRDFKSWISKKVNSTSVEVARLDN